MKIEKSTRMGIICGTAKLTGTFVGMATAVGKKTGKVAVEGAAKVGRAVSWRVVGPAPATDSKGRPTSEPSACEPGMETMTDRGHAPGAPVVALQSDIATARRELAEARREAEEAQSRLAAQLRNLQVEKESLVSDIEEARREARGMTAQAGALGSRVAALESDITAARRELEEARNEGEEAHSQGAGRLRGLPPESESLVPDLEEARSEARERRRQPGEGPATGPAEGPPA